eukprot:m.316880 g.316880  ORF g.316880 m.316880 type:complete len:108 (-) comp19682_c0_seq6:1379-1702(-)
MAHLAHGVALTHVDEGVTVPLPALPACGKLVVFIRHGQSIANTVPEGPMKLNPELLDCPLTGTMLLLLLVAAAADDVCGCLLLFVVSGFRGCYVITAAIFCQNKCES